MGYLHISNLYRPEAQKILLFRKGYALEKVHGTSAHVSFKWLPIKLNAFPADGPAPESYTIDKSDPINLKVEYFSGGAPHEQFKALFDEEALKKAFIATGIQQETTVYGEAYGGKMQGMKHVYGDQLRFIAFDIRHGDRWLPVPQMASLAESLGFEVVPWKEVDFDLATLDALRDAPSEVSARRGCNHSWREGIVLRPPIEVFFGEDGAGRFIAKHKRPEERETKTPRAVGEKLKLIEDADKAAEEWVTPNRLTHALDKLPQVVGIEQVKELIAYMIDDVLREGSGEVVDSKQLRQAIGKVTVRLFKERLNSQIKEGV